MSFLGNDEATRFQQSSVERPGPTTISLDGIRSRVPIIGTSLFAPLDISCYQLSTVAMEEPEPETPFAAVSAQTTKFGRVSFTTIMKTGDISRMLTMTLLDIPSLSGQVDTSHLLPLGRHQRHLHFVCLANILRTRMVHWFVKFSNVCGFPY